MGHAVGVWTPRLQPITRQFAPFMTAVALTLGAGASVVVPAAAASTPSAKPGAITIKGFAFSPKRSTVKAGTKIKVTNKDGTTHTFTANKGAFDSGDIEGGSSATVTIKKPGTYAYHCNIHASMTGTITAT
jgi:plastocyanin